MISVEAMDMSPKERKMIPSLITKANKFRREGKFEEAVAAYRSCIEINPESAWCHHYLGEVLFELGKWDEAVAVFSEAVELNPSSAWSYHRLGEAFFKLGDLQRSEANLRQACELNSDNYQFYKVLGWLYKKKRRWNEALSCYTKVIELNPRDRVGYYWLADIWKIKGELKKAIAYCQQGLEKYPKDSELTAQLEKLIGEKKSDRQKDKIIICAIFKNEAPYILEWIAYHKALKVDGFRIYDNGSTDGTTEDRKSVV